MERKERRRRRREKREKPRRKEPDPITADGAAFRHGVGRRGAGLAGAESSGEGSAVGPWEGSTLVAAGWHGVYSVELPGSSVLYDSNCCAAISVQRGC